jgi:hypothetical protein
MAQFTHETCFGDPVSRDEITAGRAFFPTFEGHYDLLPAGFVWRPIGPAVLIGCRLLYRASNSSAALRAFVEVACEVARNEGWLPSPVGAATA